MIKFKPYLRKIYVATMNWLTITEYLNHKWPTIYSGCCNHNSVLIHGLSSSLQQEKPDRATSEAETAYPSRALEFKPRFYVRFVCFICGFLWNVLYIFYLSFCHSSCGHCIVCRFSNYASETPLAFSISRSDEKANFFSNDRWNLLNYA